MRKPCCDKEEGINKGAWSKQEDQKLIDYITSHGEGCWRSLPKAAGLLRCGKSCRLRWINYLRPDIKRGNFAQDEEDLIIKLHALLGNRWSLIAGRLPGRTDNEVKNYWNSHIRKKLIKMGIDPNNHKPRQHHPRPTSHTSQITNSSGSMEDASTPSKTIGVRTGVGAAAGGVSDVVVSSIDQDQENSHPTLDLNLDLTISMPPSPSRKQILESKEGGDQDSKVTKDGFDVQSEPSPTLVLFR